MPNVADPAPAHRVLALLVLAFVSVSFSAGVVADEPPESPPTLESVDQRLRALERAQEQAGKGDRGEKSGASPTKTSASDRGFAISSADGQFEIKLRGLLQGDGRFFLDDEDPHFNDTFLLRRVRPTFEGSLTKLIGFRITPEFAGSSASVVDAYVDLKFSPAATVRVGKQKRPVGLERLQSGGSLAAIERAFPTELVPNRDIGVTLQGELLDARVTYQLGVYNGTADGRDARATDIDDRKETAARLFFEPFRGNAGPLEKLGFGVAGSTGRKSGTSVGTDGVLPQYRTPGQNTFFQYASGVAADGDHERLTAQGYYYMRGFGLMGEYVESSQELLLGAVADELTHEAWQLTASWVLTGEDASYRGVTKPNRPFVAGKEGWGALELVARATGLDVDDAAFPVFANPATAASKARAYGIGANWYLNANAKLVVHYTLTEFEGGAAGGADREDEKALFSRVQVSF